MAQRSADFNPYRRIPSREFDYDFVFARCLV